MRSLLASIIAVGALGGLAFLLLRFHTISKQPDHTVSSQNKTTHMIISSPAFQENQEIPVVYTCDGDNVSPPLNFSRVPDQAKSLALIVEDPDAPGGTFIHWVLYNMPPEVHEIPENNVPHVSLEGRNGVGKTMYGGPCPPSGTHHYHFKLYALDEMLSFDKPNPPSRDDVVAKMQGHIISQAELVGLYSKK